MRTDMPRLAALGPDVGPPCPASRVLSTRAITRVLPKSILSLNSLQPMLLRVTLIPAAPASCSATSMCQISASGTEFRCISLCASVP